MSSLQIPRVHPWVFCIVLALCITATVSTYTLIIAFSTYNGLIEEHPYEKGLDFQKVVKELSLGKSLQLLKGFSVSSDHREVTLQLREQNKESMVKHVVIKAIRPNDSSLDQVIELSASPNSPTVFQGHTANLASGLWMFEILIDTEQGRARYRRREVLQ